MTSTLKNSMMQHVVATAVLHDRLLRDFKPGGRLSSYKVKYDAEGTIAARGKDDLPLIQPWAPTFEEGLLQGKADHPAANDNWRRNVPVEKTLHLIFLLATHRSCGWLRKQGEGPAKIGIMELIALFQDSVETDDAELPDASLDQTLLRPVSFRCYEENQTQQAFEVFVEVTLTLAGTHRASRSCNWA